ncbi:MAG: phosphotransferase [Phycisphaerales bacterium]|nr:MAG: phosphotransferase [Phycisphaerales bacterium]
MRFQKAGDIVFCSAEERDLAFVKEAAETVYAHYHGEGPHWLLPQSDRMWKISFGGRAGVLGLRINNRVGCVKLFYDERLRTRVRAASGLSKGRRAYRNGVRLSQAGVSCPRMLGYAERRPFGPALIVTELAEGAMRFDLWALEHGVPRTTAIALAHFVRDLHDRGISHTDLSPRNILIRRSDPAGGFLLLDYEDARFGPPVSRRRRLKNLHHLHERVIGYVPLRDRLRFLHTYAPENHKAFRNKLRQMIEETDFRWLRTHPDAMRPRSHRRE